MVGLVSALSPEHRAVKNAVLRFRDAHSCRLDLSLAHEFIVEAVEINANLTDGVMPDRAQKAAMALFSSAVLLYARATKTKSGHRGTFDIRAKLDPGELAVHQVICDLRDDAVAHYGPGGSYAGPAIQKDGIFLVDGRLVAATRRIVLNPTLLASMERQIHRATILAERNRLEKEDEAVKALDAVGNSIPDLEALLKVHTTTLASFFESLEAAQAALSGSRIGTKRGMMTHPKLVD